MYDSAEFYFRKDYIEILGRKFQYTEPLLQKHIKAECFLMTPFDSMTREERNNFTGVLNLNEFEIEVIDKATMYTSDLLYLDNYLFKSNVFWWADYEYILENFYEWIYECVSDIYNDDKEYIDSNELHNFYRMIIDALKYKKDRLDIYDKICKDWDKDDYIYDIVTDEYEENIYCDLINDDKIYKVICAYDDYIQENFLYKKKLKKLKKKEKKRILDILPCVERLGELKSNRIYYEKETPTKKQSKEKQCYIIKDHNTNLYKIGNSVDPKKRERTLQAEKPTIELIKVFNENHEKELHSIYSEHRVRGEWFRLSNIQVKYICTNFE
jgi:hypothetical protein